MKQIQGATMYDIFEVAEKLNIHPTTVQRMVRAGKIKAAKIGYATYISEGSLNEYLGI